MLVGDPPQEVVQDDVLVVLAQEPPGLAKVLPWRDQLVVGAQEGDVQLGDDEVLVVARVADQGGAVVLRDGAPRLARQVVEVVLARWPCTGGGCSADRVTIPSSISSPSRGAGGP